jgi:C-terminal processing protease CtpA/Prc
MINFGMLESSITCLAIAKKNHKIMNIRHHQHMTLNTATVYKASPDSPVGIGLRAVNHNVYVSSIADVRLFSRTDLKVGQRVLSINNKNCQGLTSTEAIGLVKSATGSVTILATDEVVATTPTRQQATSKQQAAPEQPRMSHHPNGTKPGGQW